VAQLAAEYETIAAAAQHDRSAALVRRSGLSPIQAQEATKLPAFGALTAELRRAEAHYLDVESLLIREVAARGLEDAEDVAAVLCSRIATAVAHDARATRAHKTPRLIVGLIPKAIGPMPADMRRALDERSDLIESRANAVLDEALLGRSMWTRELGTAPQRQDAAGWRRRACTVAAYRDRYAIAGTRALGSAAQTATQRRDAAHASRALEAAKRIATKQDPFALPRLIRTTGPLLGHVGM
jgi:hypothetical protein